MEVEVFQISFELLFASLVVGIASPDLQFNDILSAEVINNDVHAFVVARLWLNVVIARTIDDWTKVGKEYLATIILKEFMFLNHIVGLVHVNHEAL